MFPNRNALEKLDNSRPTALHYLYGNPIFADNGIVGDSFRLITGGDKPYL